MHYYKPKQLHDGKGYCPEGSILSVESDGTIHAILRSDDVTSDDVQELDGILCPGFINTHCHLELSHMRGMLDEHTGLIPFIKGVLAKRAAPTEVIEEAIRACDREMRENGIVAVGDISNTSDTFNRKQESDIYYHTFVEIFHLDPREAENTLKVGTDLMAELGNRNLSGSLAPHAPYTVSPELFRLISTFNDGHNPITSMHNQETWAENEFFMTKSGSFQLFFDQWGIDTSAFQSTGTKSLPGVIHNMSPKGKTLLVHNTFSEQDDIQLAKRWFEEVYWCSNPNANLYIENNLPNYDVFVENNAVMTLGTDSIASNWQLSILEEVKTIHTRFSHIPLERLLTWATAHGAQMLNIDHQFGTFKPGKKPGLVHISNFENGNLTNQSKPTRLR
ncbi:MAG: amidohydrolase family protein [Flavobacteriales bacterium]|nr:amidohydrolase family protein [Bacteroidota bacterium]MCB9240059.1 amidohydrolase family protein [Flavobacteriales bacterium]